MSSVPGSLDSGYREHHEMNIFIILSIHHSMSLKGDLERNKSGIERINEADFAL